MGKAKNIILGGAIAILALLPTQEADAGSAARRRRLHNHEMRAKRRATQMAIILSLKKDTISFEKEYLRQQLDNQLEGFFRQEGKEKLISFYGENVYKDKLASMISVISSNPDKYCEFSKDVKLHNVGLREYEGEVINDTIRLKIKLDMVDSLLKDVYSDYFSEMNKKLDQQLKIFMKSKDMKNLEVYYGKEDVEWRMKKIIDEIVHNPQTYGKLDNGSYSLVDVKGKLIKEKEIKELWEKYFDENAAENFDILCKAVRAGLFVLIGSSIGCLIVIEMKK